MGEMRVIDVGSVLRGMAVLVTDTGERLGEVEDVLVHPTLGVVLAVLVRHADGELRTLGVSQCSIGADAVMASLGGATGRPADDAARQDGVLALRDLVGSNVVTDQGKLLGRVSEVLVSSERPVVAYRVTDSALQRLVGRGMSLPGCAAEAYSADGTRMIVSAGAEAEFAGASVSDALEVAERVLLGEDPEDRDRSRGDARYDRYH
jgi:uncharacterized protein YrrD